MRMRLIDLFREKSVRSHPTEAEIEHITTCLIDETKANLRKRFDSELQNELAKGSSIEADFVQRTLELLIREAIASRKILIGRIEKDVETGGLFDRYYGKMQTINTLTNSAYALMQRMDVAEERYTYERAVYKKITGKMYEPEAIPDDISVKKKKGIKRDILEVMDERKHSIEDGDDDK